MIEAITSFRGDYHCFSSYWYADVYPYWWPETLPPFPTNEHAFQAWKVAENFGTAWWIERVEVIRMANRPNDAKKFGRDFPKRPEWDDMRIDVMRYLVQSKFRGHPDLAEVLTSTGDADIIEGNTWDDRFWGAVWDRDLGWTGHNWLGHLLMEERKVLQEWYSTIKS